MTVAFDTLKFAQTLRDKAGVPQGQAEGMAQAFAEATGEQIATKGDLKELRGDLKETDSSLRAALKQTELTLRNELKETELRLSKSIGNAKADMIKWMLGQTIVIISALLALLHFGH